MGRCCSSVTCCVPEESAQPATHVLAVERWMAEMLLPAFAFGCSDQSVKEAYFATCPAVTWGQFCAIKPGNAFELLCV